MQVLKGMNPKLNSPFFVNSFCSMMMPYHSPHISKIQALSQQELDKCFSSFNYELFQNIDEVDRYLDYLILHYEQTLIPVAVFSRIVQVLVLSQKGLTFQEIQNLTHVNEEQWQKFIAVFKTFAY